jgi:hypothetical protein
LRGVPKDECDATDAKGPTADALGSFVAAALPVSMQAVDRVVHGTQAGVDLAVHLAKEGII